MHDLAAREEVIVGTDGVPRLLKSAEAASGPSVVHGRLRRDYGTGYYVRSNVHPVVDGPDMSLDEVFDALEQLDSAYRSDESPETDS